MTNRLEQNIVELIVQLYFAWRIWIRSYSFILRPPARTHYQIPFSESSEPLSLGFAVRGGAFLVLASHGTLIHNFPGTYGSYEFRCEQNTIGLTSY